MSVWHRSDPREKRSKAARTVPSDVALEDGAVRDHVVAVIHLDANDLGGLRVGMRTGVSIGVQSGRKLGSG